MESRADKMPAAIKMRATVVHAWAAIMHTGAAIVHTATTHAAAAMAAATAVAQSRRCEKNEAKGRESCDQALHDFPPMEMSTE